MLQTFYPDEYVDSTYGLPFEELYKKGYRGIIFDVDNTLVPHGAPADARSLELFARLKRIGFSTCILSNNKEPRVAPFAKKVDSPYIFKGAKPSRKGYKKAMKIMKTNESNTLFVGDLNGAHAALPAPELPADLTGSLGGVDDDGALGLKAPGHVHGLQQGLVHHHHVVRLFDVALDTAAGVADAVIGRDGSAHALRAIFGKTLDILAGGKGRIGQKQTGRLGLGMLQSMKCTDEYCYQFHLKLSSHRMTLRSEYFSSLNS